MSRAVTATIPRTVEPLKGTPARLVASSQGNVWQGIVSAADVAEHVETGEAVDQRGDALLLAHRDGLRRAARMAKAAGHLELFAVLLELIASADRMAELDDAEDYHRRQSGASAEDGRRSLLAANAIHAALLGQCEADAPEPIVVVPLLDVPAICGRQRQLAGVLETCGEPAGHERLLGADCVFVEVLS